MAAVVQWVKRLPANLAVPFLLEAKIFSSALFKVSIGLRVVKGWSGGAMVLGKLAVPGRPTVWMIVGQGPFALAVGAGGGLFGHFYSPLFFLSSFSFSLGDDPIRPRARYGYLPPGGFCRP